MVWLHKERKKFDFDFRYKNDALLAGNGGVSEKLIEEVREVLENVFEFTGIRAIINKEVSNIKPFTDGEPRVRQERQEVKEYNGKFVFFIQYPRIYDNRLRDCILELEKRFTELEIDDTKLKDLIEQFKYLGLTDLKNKVAARFISSRFNPSSFEKQICGQITSAKMGGAEYISIVMPQTVFEWSHHYAEKWRNGVYEMPAWHDFLEHIAKAGANSIINLHPHAPKEGLQTTSLNALNYVMIYPHTFTLNSNGWIYSIEHFFEKFKIEKKYFDPLSVKIEEDKNKLGDLKDISNLIMFVSAADVGADFNASWVAKRFGFEIVRSASERIGEGEKARTMSESLETYLLRLKQHTKEAVIRIYIIDDMLNTGGTSNKEALARKREIIDFNNKHNTSYKVETELIVTHLRFPEVGNIEHENLSKITIFDTVPYLPPLEDQLRNYGMLEKFEILKCTHYQLALGIALDYFLQKIHYMLELNPRTGTYREVTDEYLVKETEFGKDMRNIMRHFD